MAGSDFTPGFTFNFGGEQGSKMKAAWEFAGLCSLFSASHAACRLGLQSSVEALKHVLALAPAIIMGMNGTASFFCNRMCLSGALKQAKAEQGQSKHATSLDQKIGRRLAANTNMKQWVSNSSALACCIPRQSGFEVAATSHGVLHH